MKKISKMATASVLLFTLANPLGVLAENNVENISATSNNKLTQDITIQAKEINSEIVFEVSAAKDTYNTIIHATINGQKFTYNLGNLKKGQVSRIVQPDVSVNKKDATISKENKAEKSLPNTSVVRELVEKTFSYNTELNGNVIEAKVVYKTYELIEKKDEKATEKEAAKPVTPALKAEEPATPAPKEEKPVTPAPKEEKPVTPAPKEEKPVAPTPKAEEPATPAPKEEKLVAPTPKAGEPATPAPKEEKPVTPAPKVEEPVTPAPKEEKPATPAPKEEKPATPAPKAEEPATPAPKEEKPATPTPKEEKPVTPAPKEEKPATPAPKEEKPVTPAPKEEKPATPAPKEEKPSTPAPKEEKPATPAPKEEKPSTPAPKAEEPATPTPKEEKPATPTPKAEEPATPAPKAEEPSTPAPKAEEPATPAPKEEKPATPAPKEEKPATPAPKEEKPATPAPKAEEPATPAPKAEEPATPAPKEEKPATPTPKEEKPATPAPKEEKPATPAPKTEEEKLLEETKQDSIRENIDAVVNIKLAEIEKIENPDEKEKLKAELDKLRKNAVDDIKNAKDEEEALILTEKHQNIINSLEISGEKYTKPNFDKDNLSNGRNDGTTIEGGSTAIGHGSGEATPTSPTQPAAETTSDSTPTAQPQPSSTEEQPVGTTEPKAGESATSGTQSAGEAPSGATQPESSATETTGVTQPEAGTDNSATTTPPQPATETSTASTTSETSSTQPTAETMQAQPASTGEQPAGTTEPTAGESATSDTQPTAGAPATTTNESSASTGATTQPEATSESPAPTQPATETTSDSAPTAKPQPVATSETATAGTSSFRRAGEYRARARRVARAANQPDGTVNISYNYDGMPDINGFLSDPGENNTVAIPNSATEEKAKALVKEKIQAKAKELAKYGYKVKEEIIFEQDTNVKNFNYVVTFTKEKVGTTGFRIAPEVQVRAKKVVKRDLSNKTKQINIYYNLTALKDIAGALGELGGENMLTFPGNTPKEELKRAIEEKTKAQIEKLKKQGFKVVSTTDLDQIVEGGDSYDYVVEFTKESKSASANNTGFRKAPATQRRAKRSVEQKEKVDVHIYFNLKTLPGIAGALDIDGDTTIQLPKDASKEQVKEAIKDKIAKVESRGYKVSDFYFGAKMEHGYDFVVEFKK